MEPDGGAALLTSPLEPEKMSEVGGAEHCNDCKAVTMGAAVHGRGTLPEHAETELGTLEKDEHRAERSPIEEERGGADAEDG